MQIVVLANIFIVECKPEGANHCRLQISFLGCKICRLQIRNIKKCRFVDLIISIFDKVVDIPNFWLQIVDSSKIYDDLFTNFVDVEFWQHFDV